MKNSKINDDDHDHVKDDDLTNLTGDDVLNESDDMRRLGACLASARTHRQELQERRRDPKGCQRRRWHCGF